jgi:hypothetical protein
MPHFIQFEDDASPRRLWLLLVLLGKGSDPVEHRLGGDAQEERDAVHRDATQVEQYRINLRREGLAAWGGTGKLIPTLLAWLLRLAGGGAVVDKPITLALGTDLHRDTPSQRWAYLSRAGSITGREI